MNGEQVGIVLFIHKGWCQLKSPSHTILFRSISQEFCASLANVFHITCRLLEWSQLLYMLNMVIIPVRVLMDIDTTSCKSALFCYHELDQRHLLMKVAAQDFLGLLQWAVGSRGYQL